MCRLTVIKSVLRTVSVHTYVCGMHVITMRGQQLFRLSRVLLDHLDSVASLGLLDSQ